MTSLIRVVLNCPVCETSFATQRIASTNSVGQDTDFRPLTAGIDPQPHYVHVCPKCNFAAFEGDFGAVQDEVKQMVLGPEYTPLDLIDREDIASIRGSTKYLLAVRCYSRDDRASDLRLADLYLRASWCARQEDDLTREREAQTNSILLFEKALENGEVAENQLRTIMYLLGELYRRIGRHELAISMFDKAEQAPDTAEGEPRFAGLIERQRAAARARRTTNMQIEEDV